MNMLDILVISAIVVFIVDISGVIDSIKRFIWRWVFGNKREYDYFNLKPFDCSLCMTFWVGIIWLICTNQFGLYMLLWVCICAFFTSVIKDLMITIKECINSLVNWLYTKIN